MKLLRSFFRDALREIDSEAGSMRALQLVSKGIQSSIQGSLPHEDMCTRLFASYTLVHVS